MGSSIASAGPGDADTERTPRVHLRDDVRIGDGASGPVIEPSHKGQRFIEVSRDVAIRRASTGAAVAAPKLIVDHLALRHCARRIVVVVHAGGDAGPAPVALKLMLHGEAAPDGKCDGNVRLPQAVVSRAVNDEALVGDERLVARNLEVDRGLSRLVGGVGQTDCERNNSRRQVRIGELDRSRRPDSGELYRDRKVEPRRATEVRSQRKAVGEVIDEDRRTGPYRSRLDHRRRRHHHRRHLWRSDAADRAEDGLRFSFIQDRCGRRERRVGLHQQLIGGLYFGSGCH